MNPDRLFSAEVLSVAQVEAILAGLVPRRTEADRDWVPLDQAIGRVLAQAVRGRADNPLWDNSAMDGYAVRAADWATEPDALTLTIVDEIPAGAVPNCAIGPGQAARIFTGAMLPEGADTIVMQEDCHQEGNRVTIEFHDANRWPDVGAFVRQRGAFYRAGDELLEAGVTIGAAELALLAAVLVTEVPVWRRLRVALFSTGDELRSIGSLTADPKLAPGQLVDTNRPALAALLGELGVEVVDLGIVADDRESLRDRMSQAIGPEVNADLILSSGGVSVGDYDYVDELLVELGAEIAVKSVAMRPGKPLTVATFSDPQSRSRLYIGLPGNPVSSLVGFWRFVAPTLAKMGGQSGELQWRSARTDQPLKGAPREVYLWGRIHWDETGDPPGYRFAVAGGSHSSGNLINLGQTNALACLSPGTGIVEAGAIVRVLRVR
jgi:molybdopterin molybdotransferase